MRMRMTDQIGDKPWWTKMVVFWHENQVALTFHSRVEVSSGREAVIDSLRLQELNQFLNMRGFNIKSFTLQDVPNPPPQEESGQSDQEGQPDQETPEEGLKDIVEDVKDVIKSVGESVEKRFKPPVEGGENGKGPITRSGGSNELNSTTGKYVFASPTGHGTSVVAFFHVEPTPAYSMAGMDMNVAMSMGMTSAYGNGPMQGMSDYSGESDTTRGIVNLINNNINTLREIARIPIESAAPNWLSGGTPLGCSTHGCPIRPPLPVSTQDMCNPPTDCWRITLDDLASSSSPVRDLKGDGVTVFVLDTIPAFADIQNASTTAGDNNRLLKNMVARMADVSLPGSPPPPPSPHILINHQELPARLDDILNQDIPGTGKDLYGRLFGFEMPDHGLFVAGIVRDLVPNANIECVRVLNDFGVGDVNVLCDAFNTIHNRMLPTNPDTGQPGDLNNQSVVINLSLVATPADEDLYQPQFGFDIAHIMQLRSQLHVTIMSLISLGAVFVASAGNDSDMTANPPYRWGPRYPAAFSEVISVGAVDNQGHATTYSNYPVSPTFPNFNGIATYGGGLPGVTPMPSDPNVLPTPIVTDALRGVFSNTEFPPLDADFPSASYPALYGNAWAYWSGTSFATPIVSSVVARVLQYMQSQSLLLSSAQWASQIQSAITTSVGQEAMLTGGSSTPLQSSDFGLGVSLLQATQTCQAMPVVQAPVQEEQTAV